MSILEILESVDAPGKDTQINEALFGLRHVEAAAASLAPGARVLEIGSGSGILLGLLHEHFPDLHYDGVEPFGDGFASHALLNTFIQSQGIAIANKGYEDFSPDAPYDLIFSVNVFEHVADWRDYLAFVERSLTPGGVCIILCPNYDLPYESHFRLPILFTKDLTYRAFRRRIHAYEKKVDLEGLWRSLNFVKLSAVKRHIRTTGLTLEVDHAILDDMLARMTNDPTFRERQKIVGGVAKALKSIGLLGLLKTRALENLQPYMRLELRRKPS